MTFIHAASSHVGLVRKGNEDSGYADAQLLVVADGMGGHAAGEIASAAVVAAVCAEPNDRPIDADSFNTWIRHKVEVANQRIGDLVVADPERRGMGTTFTLVAAIGDRIHVGHIGDSRAYRLHEGRLEQLTKDHTYVQMLVDTGRLEPELAATHPRRNLLMRTIDGIHESPVDLLDLEACIGDRFLLCSDGLTNVVGDEALAEVLRTGDPTYAVSTLIDFALAGGAPDNVSVIVADVSDTEAQADAVLIGAARDEDVRDDLGGIPLPIDGPIAGGESAQLPAEPRGRPRWLLVSTVAVVTALVLFGVWLSRQWYVTGFEERVAIYHGVPQNIGPFELSRVDSITDIPLAQLPEFERQLVGIGIRAQSHQDALDIVQRIGVQAYACRTEPTASGCPA